MMFNLSSDSNRIHLLSHSLDHWASALKEMGEKPFRAKQIAQWVYQKSATGFEQMTSLSKSLRSALVESFDVFQSKIIRKAVSRDGTIKLLLKWSDAAVSECVMIPSDPTRATACISSQVGCPVKCRFCASGLDGLQRNLTAGEMVEQVLRIRSEADSASMRLANIVLMGMGEPLANYDAVMQAIRTINAPEAINIGARHITLSTVGIPQKIRKLAAEGFQLNLALSIHAPNDRLRRELIPWAENISLDEISKACRHYFDQTGREITLEYILLHGVNDLPSHARELALYAKRFRCNVNLLRYNPVPSLPYRRPTGTEAHAFQQSLRSSGINSHIRKSRGTDIDAACGQLRRREQSNDHSPDAAPTAKGET